MSVGDDGSIAEKGSVYCIGCQKELAVTKNYGTIVSIHIPCGGCGASGSSLVHVSGPEKRHPAEEAPE